MQVQAQQTPDFEPAVASVDYHRAFSTEGALATAIVQKPLELDCVYGCVVPDDVEKALRFVADL